MKYFINLTIVTIVIVCCSLSCEAAPTSTEEPTTELTSTTVNVNVNIENNLSFDILIVFIAILLYCFFRFCALNSCYGCFNRSMSQDELAPLLKKQEEQRLRSRLFLFEDKDPPAVLSVY